MTGKHIQGAGARIDVLGSRAAYTVIGAGAGLALAVWAIAHGDSAITARGGIVVGAGILFGAFAGFDLHATRHWTGRLALLLRLLLSCSAAASLTAVCGRVFGVVARGEVTKFALLGAAFGLVLWLNVMYHTSGDRAA